MRTHARTRLAIVLALWPALVTCDGGTDPPPPGWLSLTLTSPNVDAGVMLTITGGRVDSVRTSKPRLESRAVSETELRLVVGGAVSNGVIAQIWVPNVLKASAYTVVVVEAAEQTTFTQRVVTGYSVAVTPAP